MSLNLIWLILLIWLTLLTLLISLIRLTLLIWRLPNLRLRSLHLASLTLNRLRNLRLNLLLRVLKALRGLPLSLAKQRLRVLLRPIYLLLLNLLVLRQRRGLLPFLRLLLDIDRLRRFQLRHLPLLRKVVLHVICLVLQRSLRSRRRHSVQSFYLRKISV